MLKFYFRLRWAGLKPKEAWAHVMDRAERVANRALKSDTN